MSVGRRRGSPRDLCRGSAVGALREQGRQRRRRRGPVVVRARESLRSSSCRERRGRQSGSLMRAARAAACRKERMPSPSRPRTDRCRGRCSIARVRAARVVALAFVSCGVIAACAGAPAATPPPTSDPPIAASSSPEPSPPPPLDVPSPPPAPPATSTPEPVDAASADAGQPTSTAVAPPPQAPPIPCKTTDDCWVRGGKAIRRPANMRGRKFKPCTDGESAPLCRGGFCSTLGYGC